MFVCVFVSMSVYIYVCVCVCIRNSSVDGHSHCFHVLAIVKTAAVNIGVHVSLRIIVFTGYMGAFQMALVVKTLSANVEDVRLRFDPWVRKIPSRRAWQPTAVFLPGGSHGQRSWKLQSIRSVRVRHN